MKPFTSRSWPSKSIILLTVLNFIIEAVLLVWFPLRSPCHWSVEGVANGYMNKYFYLLFDLLPALIAWVLAHKPHNAVVAYVSDTPLGGIIRSAVWLLSILATWIPVYAVLIVPHFVSGQDQAVWITAMVYAVEAVLDIVVVLLVVLCAVACLRWSVYGRRSTGPKTL